MVKSFQDQVEPEAFGLAVPATRRNLVLISHRPRIGVRGCESYLLQSYFAAVVVASDSFVASAFRCAAWRGRLPTIPRNRRMLRECPSARISGRPRARFSLPLRLERRCESFSCRCFSLPD